MYVYYLQEYKNTIAFRKDGSVSKSKKKKF